MRHFIYNPAKHLLSRYIYLFGLASTLLFSSCKKLVTVDAPYTSINSGNLFSTDANSIALLTGIYAKLSFASLTSGSLTSTSVFAGLSSDELTLFSGATNNRALLSYYKNDLTNTSVGTSDFWFRTYPLIFIANDAIEGLNRSTELTPIVKKQLLGEAKFIRAFCYFYLANLYGDVPLALSTDYQTNTNLPRAKISDVYRQVISDLLEAKQLLSETFLDKSLLLPSVERIRPTKWAAIALLARAYLYTEDYKNAELESNNVINNTSLFSIVGNLDQVFLKNSNEAIWQLQPVNAGFNTNEARLFQLTSSGPSAAFRPVYLSESILNSFELNDQRKVNWVGSVVAKNITYFYPNKYKSATFNAPLTEYTSVFRLSEQLLIRSEARVQLGNTSGSVDDLNIIRKRAGLSNYLGPTDKASLLKAILHERQIEFFSEWGHRWLDLKRTGTIDAVMTTASLVKGGSWNANSRLYPIPLFELQKSTVLVQNTGY